MSFPLKSSRLEEALREGGIAIDAHLIQGGGACLFECFFWPPRPGIDYERLYIRTSPVESDRARVARDMVEEHIIPAFIEWVKALLKLSPNSPTRQKEHHFYREFHEST